MSDPFSPIPEVRKHTVQSTVDEYGDTWDETGTIKIAMRKPTQVLAEQDGTRLAIRAALDELGIRDKTEVTTIEIDGVPTEVDMLPVELSGVLQFGEPTEERLQKAKQDAEAHAKMEVFWASQGVSYTLHIDRAYGTSRWQRFKRRVKRFLRRKAR